MDKIVSEHNFQNLLFYIIIIAIIFLVGWMVYAVYGSTFFPGKNQSPGICTDKNYCIKQNVSEIPKNNLTDSQKKLSTDLLLASGSGENKENQLVYVYITTSEGADLAVINPYVSNITNTDPANHLFVAWVNVTNLTALASLDSVQSIRTVTPPINR